MRIVAIGDSFAEGVGDPGPGSRCIGWADRVALGIAAANPDREVYFANFALRGRLLEPIATDQLDAALALDPPPTHVLFNGGGNDMLRPGFSDERMIALYTRVLDKCRDADVQVIFATAADPSDLLPWAGPRMRELSLRVGEVLVPLWESRDNTVFVDNFTAEEGRTPAFWSPDRLHLSTYGHQWVASRVLTVLGVATEPPDVSHVHVPARTPLREAWYYVRHIAPWLVRRLLRWSSAYGRRPKYTQWVRVTPGATSIGDT